MCQNGTAFINACMFCFSLFSLLFSPVLLLLMLSYVLLFIKVAQKISTKLVHEICDEQENGFLLFFNSMKNIMWKCVFFFCLLFCEIKTEKKAIIIYSKQQYVLQSNAQYFNYNENTWGWRWNNRINSTSAHHWHRSE